MSDKTPEEWKELGNEAFSSKDYEKAVEYYTKAIQIDRNNHVFFSNRSASYAGLSEWQKAADDAKECIRLDPSFIKGYYRLVTAQIELQDYDGAMATLRQGLAMDSNNPQLLKQMRVIRQKQAAAKKVETPRPTGPLDDATSQELQDLQQQLAHTNREFQMVQAHLSRTQRAVKTHQVTQSELETVVDTAQCYRGIGKAFLRSSKADVVDYLNKKVEDGQKMEKELTQKMEYLERRQTSQRQNISELIGSASRE